jgi:hypothetical protein
MRPPFFSSNESVISSFSVTIVGIQPKASLAEADRIRMAHSPSTVKQSCVLLFVVVVVVVVEVEHSFHSGKSE